MGIRSLLKNGMTRGARAAYDRGDPVYVHSLHNIRAEALGVWIKAIEGVGWRFEQQQQSVAPWPNKGQIRWTLTFRRVETSTDAVPQPK
jgi:hypothetical protein